MHPTRLNHMQHCVRRWSIGEDWFTEFCKSLGVGKLCFSFILSHRDKQPEGAILSTYYDFIRVAHDASDFDISTNPVEKLTTLTIVHPFFVVKGLIQGLV